MEEGFHRLSKMQICNLIKNVPDISYSLRYKSLPNCYPGDIIAITTVHTYVCNYCLVGFRKLTSLLSAAEDHKLFHP